MNLLADDPHLPTHVHAVDQTAQLVFTLGQLPPILLFCYLAYRYSRAYRTPLPWLILAGGLLMALIEPIVDKNGLVWFPTKGQWTVFTDYGVSEPVWLVMAYFWFFGGQVLLAWHLMEQGLAQDRRWIRQAWGVIFLVDFALETAGTSLGVYFYYGRQPFEIGGFPVWWAAVNSTTPIAMAALITIFRRQLTGARLLIVLPMAPCVDAAVNAGVGWTGWDALNSTALPVAVVWAAALAATGIALVSLGLIQRTLEYAARLGLTSIDGSHAPRVEPRVPVRSDVEPLTLRDAGPVVR